LLLWAADGGKLEVWDAASEASSPLCSVLADNTAVVHIAVRFGKNITQQGSNAF